MRVLWISYYGSWTIPLLTELAKDNSVAVIVPSESTSESVQYGATIYKLQVSGAEATSNMTTSVFQKFNRVIRDFNPDIIHVHGTEKNLAQIQNFINDIPVVTSIQGILTGYIPFDCGYLKEEDIAKYRTLKNLLGRGGYLEMHRKFLNGRKCYEQDILSNCKYFFCRTNWDKAWVMFSNPAAKIYQGEELLRQSFYDNAGSWNFTACKRHTIFMPSGFNPIKGLHIALKTVVLLKKFYPDVKLVVPGLPKHILQYEGLKEWIVGEEFVSYCKDIIRTNCIEENVMLLDRLDAEGMVREMKSANVFLSPTSIDNSPNAVGEAMMIGVPMVCTPVGGTTSFLKDEENCLFAPAGDEYISAFQIKRLFDDAEFASRLGAKANITAMQRHDKESALRQYVDAYRDIIRDFKLKN